ncbi:urease accessory [Lecanosticta acicola]|uniref:Urease accessory n=1 Tax=Lecanosticta acicola TaxID=111012 RepID=A0AAI8Z9D2_9PEZI|nr:urease accessory [Lecanosticta acicola]
MASSSLHTLLLLSDSALPLGSFAFSSGLESFLAHKKLSTTHLSSSASAKLQACEKFLEEALHNVSSTALPYVLTALRHPDRLHDLDNDFDASTPCTVARRASIAQGRAMVQIWERALSDSALAGTPAAGEVARFAVTLKANVPDEFGLQPNGHFAPLFGAVCAALDVSEYDTSYLFLLNHAKAVLSAAVRASVMGPYQSQAVLAGAKLRACLGTCLEMQSRRNVRGVEDAAVVVPLHDLWMGRHELLYSRIFNS